MSVKRLSRIKKLLKKENLDALLVTNPNHIRYLCGYSGSNGLLVIDQKKALFFTDSRYTTQAAREVKGASVKNPGRSLAVGLRDADVAHKRFATIGYEADYTSVAQRQELMAHMNGALLAPTRGMIETISAVKEKSELALIEKAAKITDDAFAHTLPFIKPGVRENELAAELEYYMKRNGSDKPAFETIVASGPRSALPHGVASDRKVTAGDFITFDFGATYKGYVADMTRTVVVGKASAKQKKIYNLVLKAQVSAVKKIKHGLKAAEVDLAARKIIRAAGFGEHFGHGTGHGIGFYVHVAPRVAETSQDTLISGMVITVEPGIYLPGWGGVRIEDDVIVTARGGRVINKSPKNLLEL